MKNINKDYDKTTANHFQNPTVEKVTETKKKYRDSDAKKGLVVDSHNGKDVNLGNVLHQYMQGYYYKWIIDLFILNFFNLSFIV